MKIIKNSVSGITAIFFLLIAYGSDDNKDMEITKTSDKIVHSEIPLKIRLENNIKGLDVNNDLTKDIQSIDGIVIVLALYKSYYMIIKEGKGSINKEEIDLAKKLEKKVSISQVKDFPKLRFSYYKIMNDKLWENNVDVKIGGQNNTTLSLTAGYFASNKNIKATQETLNDMLINLRFKQVNYRWYQGEDEYTYYSLESAKDSEVIE